MTLGVYGVVGHATAQRFHEIGVRMALGAEHRDIRRLIVVNGVWLAVTGIAIGTGGAYALARFTSNLLYDIQPGDIATYAGLRRAARRDHRRGLLASGPPAQRVDPASVLRNE